MTLIGVVGGGQLGRMMALAGLPLGPRFRFLDPSAECPAAQIAECVVGRYDDRIALARFADGLDAVTYEFENVPTEALDLLQVGLPISPPRVALATSQDRLIEKRFFRSIGLATPRFAEVSSRPGLDAAIADVGLPGVLKTRRFGYDGKGQELLRDVGDADGAWSRLGENECILEERIAFDSELSVLSVRERGGAIGFYPPAHNVHRSGILRRSWCEPAPASNALHDRGAQEIAAAILGHLNYVGVLAVEMFARGDELIVSEMAPRVHNSGHWSIEGAECSQFENHVRAVAGLPLGSTACPRPCGMINIIGVLPETKHLLAISGAHLHLYGKSPRPGRKLGHVTVVADTLDILHAKLDEISRIVDSEGS